MLSKILLTLLAVIAGFLVYVAILPAYGTVTRSAFIAAPAEAIFPHINSLKAWNEWSPWAKLDPKATATFEGPESGPGSVFNWAGNSKVGAGKMTILESDANKRVKMKLDFQAPMEGTSIAEFTVAPEAAGTRVTWAMGGERPYFQRVMCTLFADTMVGGMFDKGLANLSAIATKRS